MVYLEVTDAAKSYINNYIQKFPKTLGLRLRVNNKGCNGMSYVVEFFQQKSLWDLPTAEPEIFIDVMAQEILYGAILDYIDEPMNKRFEIVNKKEEGRCGCGKSFNV